MFRFSHVSDKHVVSSGVAGVRLSIRQVMEIWVFSSGKK